MNSCVKFSLIVVFVALFAFHSFAQEIPPIPEGKSLSLTDILNLAKKIGGFLLLLGQILAAITIILSGIMYFFAGPNPQKIASAKKILIGGMIGALIIFGSGVIISTIKNSAQDPLNFFSGGGSSGGGGGATCHGGLSNGMLCVNSNPDCPNEPPGSCGGASQVLCSYSLCY